MISVLEKYLESRNEAGFQVPWPQINSWPLRVESHRPEWSQWRRRPGPMQYDGSYLERKYVHKRVKIIEIRPERRKTLPQGSIDQTKDTLVN